MLDDARGRLRRRYEEVRQSTEALCAPLSAEDQQLQSMPDASPAKWHRGHTTWFFDAFVLTPRGVTVAPQYGEILNSYYEGVGPRHPRAARGLLSRPSIGEIADYRRAVDGRVIELIAGADERALAELTPLVELGLAHEEQHQELILTDILHAFAQNPLGPCYRAAPPKRPTEASSSHGPMRWMAFDGGLVEIGARKDASFSFDNEQPRHRAWIEPFEMASRSIHVGELKAFIRDGGYTTPSLWLSEGLDFVRSHGITAPMHARFEDGALLVFGLDGVREAADDEPSSHLSYYEADALARFLGGALPTEQEWELAASTASVDGNFRESGALRPLPAPALARTPAQLFGDVWEWTRSSYAAYPGYKPASGALGEYNGKFMANQYVLRGGSCFTPRAHVRATYRNFWHPQTRFQMTGARLVRPRT